MSKEKLTDPYEIARYIKDADIDQRAHHNDYALTDFHTVSYDCSRFYPR